MFCVRYEIYTPELHSLVYIPYYNTKHWITYTKHWKHWPGCTCTLNPGEKHFLVQIAIDKDSVITRHMIWVRLHRLRIRVECTNSGDWSAYTSVTWNQGNTSQIILKKKMLQRKSICSMWTHLGLKRKRHTPKWNAAKCYIMCIFHDVKPACQ